MSKTGIFRNIGFWGEVGGVASATNHKRKVGKQWRINISAALIGSNREADAAIASRLLSFDNL